MSKIFFDKLVSVKQVEKYIAKLTETVEERHELWQLVDEIVHHRVLHCVLNELPKKHHKEFLVKLYEAPHDEDLLAYSQKKITKDISEFIKLEVQSIENEILKDLQTSRKK